MKTFVALALTLGACSHVPEQAARRPSVAPPSAKLAFGDRAVPRDLEDLGLDVRDNDDDG